MKSKIVHLFAKKDKSGLVGLRPAAWAAILKKLPAKTVKEIKKTIKKQT